MRGTLVVVLVVYLSELLPERGSAEPTIVFDAGSQKVVSAAVKRVTPSDQVTVVITNVNTFTHRYNVERSRIDYHNLSIPSVLGAIANFKPPSVSSTGTIPSPAESFQTSVRDHSTVERALELFESNRQKLLSLLQEQRTWTREQPSEALPSEFKELEADMAELDKQMGYMPSARVLRDIAAQIDSNNTNVDIRNGVLNVIFSELEPLVASDAAAKKRVLEYVQACSNVRFQAGAYLDLFIRYQPDIFIIVSEIADSFSVPDEKLHIALSNWNRDYAQYAFSVSSPSADSRYLAAKNALIQDYVRRFEVLRVDYDRSEIAKILLSVLDPRIVPTVLVRHLTDLRADTVSIWLQDDYLVASSAVDALAGKSDPIESLMVARATGATHVYPLGSVTVEHRPVLDYSLGVGALSYSQVNYYIDADRIVQRGSADFLNAGAATLMQFYLTDLLNLSIFSLTVGPCFGVILADQTNYVAGGSAILSIAERIRVSASYGWAVGRVNSLNGDAVGAKALGGSVSMASHMTQGAFFSLTGSFGF